MADLYFGKYRGIVTNIADPQNCGRIQARVPAITGNFTTGWCLPCFPASGSLIYPKVGDNVWIEFERGKVDYPIWSGVWFPKADSVPKDVLTANGGKVDISNGEVTLSNSSGESTDVHTIVSEIGESGRLQRYIDSEIAKAIKTCKEYTDSKIQEVKTWADGKFRLK